MHRISRFWILVALASLGASPGLDRQTSDEPHSQAFCAWSKGDLLSAVRYFESMASREQIRTTDLSTWMDCLASLDRPNEAVAIFEAWEELGRAATDSSRRVAAETRPMRVTRLIADLEQRRVIHQAEASVWEKIQSQPNEPFAVDGLSWKGLSRVGGSHIEALQDQVGSLLTFRIPSSEDELVDRVNNRTLALNRDPMSRAIVEELSRARKLLQDGRSDEATTIVRHVQTRLPHTDFGGSTRYRLYEDGWESFRKGDLASAERSWTESHRDCSLGQVLLPHLSLIFWLKGDVNSAREKIEDYCRKTPKGQFATPANRVREAFQVHKNELADKKNRFEETADTLGRTEFEHAKISAAWQNSLKTFLFGTAALGEDNSTSGIVVGSAALAPKSTGFYFHLMRTDEPGGYVAVGPFDSQEFAESARKWLLSEKNPYILRDLGLSVGLAASGVFEVPAERRRSPSRETGEPRYREISDLPLDAIVLEMAVQSCAEMMGHGIQDRREGISAVENAPGLEAAREQAKRQFAQLRELGEQIGKLRIFRAKREAEFNEYQREAPRLAEAFAALREELENAGAVEGIQMATVDLWTASNWQISGILRGIKRPSAISKPPMRRLAMPERQSPWSTAQLLSLADASDQLMRSWVDGAYHAREVVQQATQTYVHTFLAGSVSAPFEKDLRSLFSTPIRQNVEPNKTVNSNRDTLKASAKIDAANSLQIDGVEFAGCIEKSSLPVSQVSIAPGTKLAFIDRVPFLIENGQLTPVGDKPFTIPSDSRPVPALRGIFYIDGKNLMIANGIGPPVSLTQLPLDNSELVSGTSDELLVGGDLSEGAALYRLRANGEFGAILYANQLPQSAAHIREELYLVADGTNLYRLMVGSLMEPVVTIGELPKPAYVDASVDETAYISGEAGLFRLWPNGVLQLLDDSPHGSLILIDSDVWSIAERPMRLQRIHVSAAKMTADLALDAFFRGHSLLQRKEYRTAAESFQDAYRLIPGFVAAKRAEIICAMRRFPQSSLSTLIPAEYQKLSMDTLVRIEDNIRNARFDQAEDLALGLWEESELSLAQLLLLYDNFDRLGLSVAQRAAGARLSQFSDRYPAQVGAILLNKTLNRSEKIR